MDKTTLENKIEKVDKSLLDVSGLPTNVSKVLRLREIAKECNHLAAEMMQNFSINELIEIVDRL